MLPGCLHTGHLPVSSEHTHGISTASSHTCACGLPHPGTGVTAHVGFAHMLTPLPATWGTAEQACLWGQTAGRTLPRLRAEPERQPHQAPGSACSPGVGEGAAPSDSIPSRPLSHSGHCHASRDGPRVPGNPAAPGQPPPFRRHQHLLLLPSRPKTQEGLADQWAGALRGQGGFLLVPGRQEGPCPAPGRQEWPCPSSWALPML